MLLQDDFSYSISISDDLEQSKFEIPALIIQPYVENAFKHGLRHKNGYKQLSIDVSQLNENEIIEIRITDNGIGRVAADAINRSNPTHHQSFATSAIEKRISLLNHEQKNVVGVEIIDNFEEGKSIGTSVIIRIHV
jgi:sensor histidine kinase YesM